VELLELTEAVVYVRNGFPPLMIGGHSARKMRARVSSFSCAYSYVCAFVCDSHMTIVRSVSHPPLSFSVSQLTHSQQPIAVAAAVAAFEVERVGPCAFLVPAAALGKGRHSHLFQRYICSSFICIYATQEASRTRVFYPCTRRYN